jgi:hypothetical protein
MSERRLLVLLFVITLPLVTPKIRAADEIEYFAYLRSLAFDRDLEFGNEYQHFYDLDPHGLAGFKTTFLELREPATGRHINFGPMGSAVLWSPFYLLAHLFVHLVGGVADGFSPPYVASVCYGSAFYGFLGLLLIHDMLLRFGRFPTPAAGWAVAAVFVATPVLYYLTVAPGFSHACSLFVVSLLVWLWLRARRREEPSLEDAILLGVAGGLSALVREQDGLFLVVPALDLTLQALRRRRFGPGLVRLLVMGATAALVFMPQVLAYKTLNGTYGPSRMVYEKMNYASPHFLEVLFDPGHGLFAWSPILLLAVLGLGVAARGESRAEALWLAFAFLLQVWVCGSLSTWTQAGAFGSRRFIASSPALAFGLAALIAAALPRLGRVSVAGTLVLIGWWNVSLIVQFGLRLMDRQKLEWPRVAVNQVVEVPPRLARVAWLFFTDRERLVREGG